MAWWNRNALGIEKSLDLVERSAQPPHYGPEMSIQDPSGWLDMRGGDSGVVVTEWSALGSTAFFRSIAIIAGTIATLPLKSYRTDEVGARFQVPSVFDNPGAQYFTPFEWVELVLVHLLLHGNAYLLHLYGGGGQLIGFFPLHPDLITPKWVTDADGRIVGKLFCATVNGKAVEYTELQMTQIMGLGTDGLQGLSVLTVARNAIGTGLAGDKAAARMFGSGMLVGGLVTANESMDEDEGREVMSSLKAKLTGSHNAGDIALVNASLTFTPWSMNSQDAQFLESRQYQVEEISRLLGVPKVLLAEDGASSWGTGIGQLLNWMARTTFQGWTTRIEQRLSLILASPRHCEFEYAGLLQGTPAEEIALLIQQKDAGILTLDEVRAIRNLPPLTPAPASVDSSPLGAPPLPAATN